MRQNLKGKDVEDGALLGLNQPRQIDERGGWVAVCNSVSQLELTAFEAKALYVFAMMRQLADGSIALQRESLHLASFVLLADAIEALGRCRTGCQDENAGSGKRLREGLQQLERHHTDGFLTMFGRYKIDVIVAMRNFTTHGGTTPRQDAKLDAHLSALLINRFGDELTDYWIRLRQDGNPERQHLADARIRPLWTGGRPVFVEDMFKLMSKPGAKAGQGLRIELV